MRESWREEGNWKLISPDGDTYIKVTDFPVPEAAPVGGESMWVRRVSGTDNEGVGELGNEPVFCTAVSLGDLIRYGKGTDEAKPKFLAKEKG